MRSKRIWLLVGLILFSSVMVACDVGGDKVLRASGVVEAAEVIVAPELGGRVTEVFVEEGDAVIPGEALLRMGDELYTGQLKQAVAGRDAAQANLDAANAMLTSAQAGLDAAQAGLAFATANYEMELAIARAEVSYLRTEKWAQVFPYAFDLPVWYFEDSEYLEGAEAEVAAASEMLADERANVEAVLEAAGGEALIAAEARLTEAQAAFEVAKDLWERRVASPKRNYMDDFIDDFYDEAKEELEAAQDDYDELLSDDQDEDVLEARARLAVAVERYETALDQRDQLLVGDESPRVKVALAGLQQAEANLLLAEASVAQAEANIEGAEKLLAQAQAALDLLDLQRSKLTVTAAVPGVVMTRSVEPGEVIAPGMTVMTIGQLERMTITVYLPEDRYGQIDIGDSARVSVDSFPDETFDAVVVRIADRAEYTPRNVQTEEDRRMTVYAVELVVEDPGGSLKPGMPADVEFEA